MIESKGKFPLGDPRSLPTEELIAVLLGFNLNISRSKLNNLTSRIANYLRSKIHGKVTVEDLIQFEGIDKTKAMQILSALELGQRYYVIKHNTRVKEDWDFANLKQSERQYGVHFFHHYTAKFIPQIPSRIIRQYTTGNSIVLDPFMGSGTTLVEAKMLGCHSYGLDTNPMAIKIAQAKTLKFNNDTVNEINTFLKWLAKKKLNQDIKIDSLPNNILFDGSNLWFRNDVAFYLNEILHEIEKYSPAVKNFIEVGLSTLLKGISNARMDSVTPVLPDKPVYIDRKHYYREVNNLTRNIPVYYRLHSQIRRMKSAILEFNKESDEKLICKPILGDARELNKHIDHCDLVVTSPPYWSAQNYEKIHMLSMKLFLAT